MCNNKCWYLHKMALSVISFMLYTYFMYATSLYLLLTYFSEAYSHAAANFVLRIPSHPVRYPQIYSMYITCSFHSNVGGPQTEFLVITDIYAKTGA
jgi:hypothetical protein